MSTSNFFRLPETEPESIFQYIKQVWKIFIQIEAKVVLMVLCAAKNV